MKTNPAGFFATYRRQTCHELEATRNLGDHALVSIPIRVYLIRSNRFQQARRMRGATCQCQIAVASPHFIPGDLPVICVAHGSRSHRSSTDRFPILIAWWKQTPYCVARCLPKCSIRSIHVIRVAMTDGGNVDLTITPVNLGNLSTADRNLTGRMHPDDVVTGGECEKESGEDW